MSILLHVNVNWIIVIIQVMRNPIRRIPIKPVSSVQPVKTVLQICQNDVIRRELAHFVNPLQVLNPLAKRREVQLLKDTVHVTQTTRIANSTVQALLFLRELVQVMR